MHASEVTPEIAGKANELYWASDRSVNQIAEDLDLSKGALYATLVPLPSGEGCPLCGDEVVWANRTARDRDQLSCPTCDWDGSADETIGLGGKAATEAAEPASEKPRQRARSRTDEDEAAADGTALAGLDDETPVPPPPLLTGSMRTLAGGAAVGAAVGLVLVWWARRR